MDTTPRLAVGETARRNHRGEGLSVMNLLEKTSRTSEAEQTGEFLLDIIFACTSVHV
jgi:hypothetical protein